MSKLTITWKRVLEADSLKRSSHTISAHAHQLFILSGELSPRTPAEPQVLALSHLDTAAPKIQLLNATLPAPSPRIGSASATINGTTLIFSGRSGPAMQPVAEDTHPAGLWSLSHSHAWEFLAPLNAPAFCPVPRSYHAMAADGVDLVYLHGGCAAEGRLADFWSFSLSSREWMRLSHGPGMARGGVGLAFCPVSRRVLRFGGFDGETEVGGVVDVYEPESDVWREVAFEADGKAGPLPRSVAGFVPVSVGGKAFVLSVFGEGAPSSEGHAGAGKFFGDVWAWDVLDEMWVEVFVSGEQPAKRGWLAADTFDYESGEIVIHGGLGENNERLGDVWIAQIAAI